MYIGASQCTFLDIGIARSYKVLLEFVNNKPAIFRLHV